MISFTMKSGKTYISSLSQTTLRNKHLLFLCVPTTSVLCMNRIFISFSAKSLLSKLQLTCIPSNHTKYKVIKADKPISTLFVQCPQVKSFTFHDSHNDMLCKARTCFFFCSENHIVEPHNSFKKDAFLVFRIYFAK